MLGQLPTELTINGRVYRIRSDYRNILTIFEAFDSPDLTDSDKLSVCLQRMFPDWKKIPRRDYQEAIKQAYWFMECGEDQDRQKKAQPRLVNWKKDERMIFPAINKVAGTEVRALPYMHWWTFVGYFQNTDREDLWGLVLSIRQKRSKGKKLEKWEREFLNGNKDLCSVEIREKPKTTEDKLQDIFDSLEEEKDGD